MNALTLLKLIAGLAAATAMIVIKNNESNEDSILGSTHSKSFRKKVHVHEVCMLDYDDTTDSARAQRSRDQDTY